MTETHDKIAMECYKKINGENFTDFSYKFFIRGKKRIIICSWVDDQGFKTTHSEEWED